MTARKPGAMSKADAGRLGAAARHGFPPDEQARRAEVRRRVREVLGADPLPLAELAHRAGVSRAGAATALYRLSARSTGRAVHTPEGWIWSA